MYVSLVALLTLLCIQQSHCNYNGSIPTHPPQTSQDCSSKLNIETARVEFGLIVPPNTSLNGNITQLYVYAQNTQCYHCLYLPLFLEPLPMLTYNEYEHSRSNESLSDPLLCAVLDTQFAWNLYVSSAVPFADCPNNSTCNSQPSDSSIVTKWSDHYNDNSATDILLYYEDSTVSSHHSSHSFQKSKTSKYSTYSPYRGASGLGVYTIVGRDEVVLDEGHDKFISLYLLLAILVFSVIFYNLYLLYLNSLLKAKQGRVGSLSRDGSVVVSAVSGIDRDLADFERAATESRLLSDPLLPASDHVAHITHETSDPNDTPADVSNNAPQASHASAAPAVAEVADPAHLSQAGDVAEVLDSGGTASKRQHSDFKEITEKSGTRSKIDEMSQSDVKIGLDARDRTYGQMRRNAAHRRQGRGKEKRDGGRSKHTRGGEERHGRKEKKQSKRLVSLDAMRGICVVVAVFVSYGGGGYYFLQQGMWQGMPTVYDSVLPLFAFVMGASMSLVFPKYLYRIHAKKQHKWTLLKKLLVRSAKLYAINLLLASQTWVHFIQLPGALFCLAIAYLLNGVILLYTEPTRDEVREHCKPKFGNLFVPEIALFWRHMAWNVVIAGAAVIMEQTLSTWHECPKGYIGPGGIGNYGKYPACTGGAHLYVDCKFFGYDHLFRGGNVRDYYGTGYYEPFGVLSSLMVTLQCFVGVLMGRVLYVHYAHKQRIIRWCLYCLLFGCICAGLSQFSAHDGVVPINANTWSLSFVMLESMFGTFILIVVYSLIDVWKVWKGQPFQFIGRNSILIWVGSQVLKDFFPFSWKLNPDTYHTHGQLVASNALGTFCWILIAWYLHSKRFYLTL